MTSLEKFTKENVYKYLKQLGEAINFADEESQTLFNNAVEDNFKPQKGGGATANPPKEIDGVMYHYCRMFQDYIPEDEMCISQGKVKGISKIGQKHSYELKKQAEQLKMDSIPLFQKGDIDGGNAKMEEAKEVEKRMQDPETYVAERDRLLAEAQKEEQEKSLDADEAQEDLV